MSSKTTKSTKTKQSRKTTDLDKEIDELFKVFDKNGDKSITASELGAAMRFLNLNPTKKEIADTMKLLDVNNDNKIQKDEFRKFLKNYLKENPEVMTQEESIRAAFKVFDRDGNGYIDGKELKVAMTKLGEALTDKELGEMMRDADANGDGKIDYNEFVKIWTETEKAK
ncbi:neo-calmodulin-like isoform X1 [Mytilus galloprovincialis]|uniref:neo-calmodulin-like isoform X1 n=1 Tax=Mytilus galloprovincialis TaxID=29158 RepID=UPI003F7BD146